MQEMIAQNEAKAQVLHDYSQKTYIPTLQDHLGKSFQYLQQEEQDFRILHQDSEQTQFDLQQRKEEISKTLKQINEKVQKESDLQKKAEQYKKAKKDELSAYQKTIDSISAAMKEACSKINIEALSKIGQLPDGVDSVFKKLFYIIYNEDQNKFQWNTFKEIAFKRDKGEDFQSRMANFQFRQPRDKEDFLLQMKEDPQFGKAFRDPQYSESLLDIADWIHYAVTGIDTQKKKDESQISFDKIEKEFATRGKELQSLQKGQNFWQQSLDYAENQISFYNNLLSEVLNIQQQVGSSKQNLEKHIEKVVSQVKEINDLMVPPF
ncbi:hypothetical protein pb186bvf_014577 [Paramecium bursaria]